MANDEFVIYTETNFYTCVLDKSDTGNAGERVVITEGNQQDYSNILIDRVDLPFDSPFLEFPNELFEIFKNLKEIVAKSANLERIGKLIDCENLVHLDVSHNSLKELSLGNIEDCLNLERIQAAHNQITHLESGFLLKFKNFEILDISHNRLMELKMDTLLTDSSSDCLYFYLDHNPIERIVGVLSASKVELYLQNCQVRSIDIKFLDDFTEKGGTIDFTGNKCVNGKFKLGPGEIESFKRSLASCIENFKSSVVEVFDIAVLRNPHVSTSRDIKIGRLICKPDFEFS